MTRHGAPLGGHYPWPGGRYQAGSDTGAEALEAPVPRQEAPYTCQRGHSFTVAFAAKATPPGTWDCRCGATATYGGPGPAEPVKPDKRHPPKLDDTPGHHYRLLLMRRTPEELSAILADAIRERCTH